MGEDRDDVVAALSCPTISPQLTLEELAAPYLASCEFRRLKARATEEIRFRAHLLPHLGSLAVAKLDASTIAGYRESRSRERCLNGHDAPPSAATRNREVKQLSACLSWAVVKRLISANPILGVPMEPEGNVRLTKLTAADIDRVLLVCSPRLRAMVGMTFGSGLRRAEVCDLQMHQITWRSGVIELHDLDSGGTQRVTVMTKRASQYLRRYLDERKIASPNVFCTVRGGRVEPRNFLREFQEACERAGVKAAPGERIWIQDLRDGFIRHQIAIGTPAKIVVKMTGHTSGKVLPRLARAERLRVAEAKMRADLFDAGRRPPHRAPIASANGPSDGDEKKECVSRSA